MLHTARCTVLSLALAVGAFLAFAGSASAQDPVTILDQEVGGYSAEAIVDFGPASNPNPLVPGTTVRSDVGNFTLEDLTVNRERLCEIDAEILSFLDLPDVDLIPCRVDGQLTVPTPCEDLRRMVRELDLVGTTVDGAITTLANTIDSVGNTLHPEIWNGAARRATDACASQVPAFDGRSAIAENEVLAQIRNPRFCPNTFGICFEEAPIGQTIADETAPVGGAFVTPRCGSAGVFFDCERIDVGPGVDVPGEVIHDLVDDVPEEIRVLHFDVDEHDRRTPFAHVDRYEVRSRDVAECTVPGRFDPRGDSKLVPFTHTDVSPPGSGQAGPLVNELSLVADAANGLWATFFGIWIPLNEDVTSAGEGAFATLYQLWPDDGKIFTREAPANSGNPLTPAEQPRCDTLQAPPPPPPPTVEVVE